MEQLKPSFTSLVHFVSVPPSPTHILGETETVWSDSSSRRGEVRAETVPNLPLIPWALSFPTGSTLQLTCPSIGS